MIGLIIGLSVLLVLIIASIVIYYKKGGEHFRQLFSQKYFAEILSDIKGKVFNFKKQARISPETLRGDLNNES